MTGINAHRQYSHKHTLVYKWLMATPITPDRYGDAVAAMRKRDDMPGRFITKKYMRQFMKRAGIHDDVIEHILEKAWQSFRTFDQNVRSGDFPA